MVNILEKQIAKLKEDSVVLKEEVISGVLVSANTNTDDALDKLDKIEKTLEKYKDKKDKFVN